MTTTNTIEVLAEYVQFLRYIGRKLSELNKRGLDRNRAAVITATQRDEIDAVIGEVYREHGSAVVDSEFAPPLEPEPGSVLEASSETIGARALAEMKTRNQSALDIAHAWHGGRMHATASDVVDEMVTALKGSE
jgi:hypothetical protein